MKNIKKRWVDQIQPYIGILLLAIGILVISAAYERGSLLDSKTLRQIAPAAFMAFAGLGMVMKVNGGRRRLLFLFAAVGVSFLIRVFI